MNSNSHPANATIERVSVHGGHSGQFCQHAQDTLEDVIQAYVEQGFSWVGITEHMPPLSDTYRYDDESVAGLSAAFLQQRFRSYFSECRRLQQHYAGKIEIFTAFETEMYEGAIDFIRELMRTTQPDYIVGSVHHVGGICIDYDKNSYDRAVSKLGSLEALYCEYFDAQYTLLAALKPAVVGHFDLVRIFDDHFPATLALESVTQRVMRNLAFMAQEGLIMDFNLRGIYKGSEPYPCRQILAQAQALGVKIAPGDDSHGVRSVGLHYDAGVRILAEHGLSAPWPRPAIIEWEEK